MRVEARPQQMHQEMQAVNSVCYMETVIQYLHMCKIVYIISNKSITWRSQRNKVNVIFSNKFTLLREKKNAREREKKMKEGKNKNARRNVRKMKKTYLHTQDRLAHTFGVKQRDIPFNFPFIYRFPFSFNIRIYSLSFYSLVHRFHYYVCVSVSNENK